MRAHIAVDEALVERAPPTLHRCIRAVVANGSSLGRFERKSSYALHRPARLVMVANLRPQKAHPVLFDALAILRSRGLATEVDLLGGTDDPAYLAACTNQVAASGLGESVRFAGTCDDVGPALAQYDLGVLTSASESGPVALIEYLAAGLPFVVTDVGNVPRSLPDELRSWVVSPGDAEAFSDLVEEALRRTDQERRESAAVGLRFVHDAFSIERTVDGVEAVYRELLKT